MGTKTLFVTITGRPNAGKSSLLNAVIGEKIAVVSDKPQTTRTKITGVLTQDEVQYVFMDTPGMHKAKNKLGEHMVKAVEQSISGMDLILLVADCTSKIGADELSLLKSFEAQKAKAVLVLNKIDLADKSSLLAKIAEYSSLYSFEAVLPVSVLTREGMDSILPELDKHAKEGPFYFPEDTLTDQPEKVLAAEMIREKLLCLLSEEVPHGIAVTVESMKEREEEGKPAILDLSAYIYCEKESHKGIVIGKGGAMLKKAGTLARQDLESFFQIKVNLQLWVKVKPDWRNREGMIRNFGL